MLDVAILGPLEVHRDGRPVGLGPPKQRAVLAVLVLDAGRVVSTDRLVDTVWGDDAPGSVLSSLQAYVSNLRRLLRDDERGISPLTRQAPGYRLDLPGDHLDSSRFLTLADRAHAAVDAGDWDTAASAAQAALDLWRGPVLAEFADEDWARATTTVLDERRDAVRQAQVTALLGLDRLGPAVARSGRLLEDRPLDERAGWLAAVARHRSGRAPEALDLLRAYARRLDEELGLEPGPALRDLQGAILRQDPELETWPRPPSAPEGRPPAGVPGIVEPERPPAVAEPSAPAAPSLVGRAPEVALGDEVLDPHAPGWLVLEGVAGIGKSRLAQELADHWVARGGTVVRSGCPDDDTLPAWWPLRQVLRDLGADPDDVLVPPSGVDIDEARYATFERVRSVLGTAAAATPLLLHLEDVHWADPTTLAFLSLLAESRSLPALGVLLTARPTNRGAGMSRLRAAVARLPHGRLVAVPPLARAEVAELVGRVSGEDVDAQEADLLAARTGGNPFFVSEYARLPRDVRRGGGVPGAVRSVLDRRLATVDPEVMQVLRVAAVAGHELDLELLSRVTRMDRDDLADLLDEAADERIIVPAERGYEFVHALMREQVAEGLAGLRRQRLHLRIGTQLAQRRDPDALVRRAGHLVAALPLGEPADVVEACRAAALDADGRWQSEDAAAWWGSAVDATDLLPPDEQGDRDQLVASQVAALARAGRGSTAVSVVDAALESALRAGRLDATGRIASTLLRTSGAWPWASYPGESPVADRLVERLGTLEEQLRGGDPPGHVRVLAALAVGRYYDPDGVAPDRLSAQAVAEAEALGDPDVLADALLGRALAFSGVAARSEEVADTLDRLATVPHAQQRLDEVVHHNLGSMARLCLGEVDRAAEHVRAGIVGCELLRLPVSRAQLRWMSANLSQWHGDDLDRTAAQMEHGFAVHQATELYESGVRHLSALTLAWDLGAIASLHSRPSWPSLEWVTTLAEAVRGEPGSAEALAAEAHRDEAPLWTTHGRLTLLGHVVSDLGRDDLAAAVRERLTPFAGRIANVGQVGNVGPVDLALARLALLAGDPDAARAHLAAATELCRRGGAVRHLARCRALADQLDAA